MISNTHQSHNPIVYALVFLPLLGACASSADPDNFGPRVLKDCDVCPELIRIEPGEFQMGLADGEIVQPGFPKGQELQELPAHRVQIDYPFAIGRYEVSIGEFAAFAAATDFDGKGCLVLIAEDKDWILSPDADFLRAGIRRHHC
jgi:formylglycine-generating enzyme required for sulfatase activity